MFTIGDSHWLVPGEQEEAIAELLVRGGLLQWDNGRKLPLKSGGTTDVYVNLRDMRKRPWTIAKLAELYENPLRRLRPDCFVEVPDSVSPLAGHLSVITGIPLVTVREEEKPGRVVKGRVVGDLRRGLRVVIIDDVVTDAASKLAALIELRSIGAEVLAIVVLVDRQQGWKQKLAQAGFGDVPVWAGMTLHDVRKHLVVYGLMQRCDPAIEAKNPIIVALDGKPWDEVFPIIDRLRPTGCILKVNDLLWGKGIDKLVPDLSVYGRVMADMKNHDIPNTVGNNCKLLRTCPPWAVTVHASGGRAMIAAAREALADTPTKILAVTVLTSIDPKTCEEIYVRQPLDQVLKLAEIVTRPAEKEPKRGVDGFVCSPQEVKALKERYPDAVLITPGVRSPGQEAGDQQRVDTPQNAMVNGATNLVMGRQILGAPDPIVEVFRVMKEELNIGIEQ